MPKRQYALPPLVLEILRFCVVAFMAGIGYSLATGASPSLLNHRVGPLDPVGLGTILGVASGYVLGGVIGRLAVKTVVATESALSGKSAEQLLAGLAGGMTGVLFASL